MEGLGGGSTEEEQDDGVRDREVAGENSRYVDKDAYTIEVREYESRTHNTKRDPFRVGRFEGGKERAAAQAQA